MHVILQSVFRFSHYSLFHKILLALCRQSTNSFIAMQLAGSSFLPRFIIIIIIITFNCVILVRIIGEFCFYFDLLRFSGGSRCWLFCDTFNQPSMNKIDNLLVI